MARWTTPIALLALPLLTACGGDRGALTDGASDGERATPASGAPVAAATGEERSSGVGMGMVLVASPMLPDTDALRQAVAGLGVELDDAQAEADDEGAVLTLTLRGGGFLALMLMNAPHPDAPGLYYGPFSPDKDAAVAAPAHVIVTLMGAEGDPRTQDAVMARLVAAVARTTPAVGVMMGHGITFYSPEFFADAVDAAAPGTVPAMVCVDLTMGRGADGRFSMLTHGLGRYDREEVHVTTSGDANDAADFLYAMVRWMIMDPAKHFPTGDTVGRTAEEKVTVRREPSPAGDGTTVVQLDMP